jgi:hypothetical protein
MSAASRSRPDEAADRDAIAAFNSLVEAHLAAHVGDGPGALLFPARHGGSMAPSSLYKVWYPARGGSGSASSNARPCAAASSSPYPT